MIAGMCRGQFNITRCLLIVTVLCVTASCTSMLFQPLKQHFFTPAVVDVKYEDVYIESDRGLNLHGWKLFTLQQKKRLGVISAW